jgi:hypothetical protein
LIISFRLIEERFFFIFLIVENGCTPAYPPPLGFLCVGFWRRVGGGAVFGAGVFLFFYFIFIFFVVVKTAFFIFFVVVKTAFLFFCSRTSRQNSRLLPPQYFLTFCSFIQYFSNFNCIFFTPFPHYFKLIYKIFEPFIV